MFHTYINLWKEYTEKYGPSTALLLQVGGFFEIYDTENLSTGISQANVRKIAELCQLSLTVHALEDMPDTNSLFGGFPEHSLSKFERILVQAGYTVVVVVQKKGKTGAVEQRIVDHISSPGCFVDGASIVERRLVGCVLESMGGPHALQKVLWAAAALDIATGRIWFIEGTDRDRLHQFLCMHPPSELVLWSDGLPAAAASTEQLRAIVPTTHIRGLAASSVAIEEASLEKLWTNARKRLEWIHRMPQARRAVAALMDFAGDHIPSSLKNIHLPEVWVPDGEVRLGNAALEQLGLLSLSGGKSLMDLIDKCRSTIGRRLMRSRLMRPITNIPELERRLRWVSTMEGVRDHDISIERSLRSLYDMSRLFRRLEIGSATIGDVTCLLRSYESAQELIRAFSGTTCASPHEADMLGFLDGVFAKWDVPALVELSRESKIPTEVLPWRSSSAPEYATVAAEFAIGLAIRNEAKALCPTELHLDDAEGGGFRITGTKRRIQVALAALRDGGDTTATVVAYKNTASLETARLEDISRRHRAWWSKWVSTWAEEWAAACGVLAANSAIHQQIERWCAEIDLSWTVQGLAAEWLWTHPQFVPDTDSFLDVVRLRHPILERIQTQVPYVPHTLCLDSGSGSNSGSDSDSGSVGLLLYGMNASGKSSLMKALGLCVLLAQSGFPVPAESCRLSPFSSIFTRILGNDNLWSGLSSFAVEMTEFREILHHADQNSLVLGDELCSGTESLSATALVAAGIETLAQRKSKFVFATHLHELATIVDVQGVRAVHLKVRYDAVTDRLIYDRNLADGPGSSLYGLEVCRALDLPAGYLDRATTIRNRLAGVMTPKQSSYSVAAVVDCCAVCGSSSGLEMHHIVPQKDAAAAKAAGFQIHSGGNLVCLCAVCHDHHHGGRLVIEGWQDTSDGRKLKMTWTKTDKADMSSKADKSDKAVPAVSDEVRIWIREQKQRKVRATTIRRLVEQTFHIPITIDQIRGI